MKLKEIIKRAHKLSQPYAVTNGSKVRLKMLIQTTPAT